MVRFQLLLVPIGGSHGPRQEMVVTTLPEGRKSELPTAGPHAWTTQSAEEGAKRDMQ